jgi:hypothetical protein
MTLGSFIIGLVFFGIGFTMLWKRQMWHEYLGDLGMYFDKPGSSWLTWEMLGLVLMFAGFMYGVGLLQAFVTKLLQGFFLPTIGM